MNNLIGSERYLTSIVGIKLNENLKEICIDTNRKTATNMELLVMKANDPQKYQSYLRKVMKKHKKAGNFEFVRDEEGRIKPFDKQEKFAIGSLMSLSESAIRNINDWEDILKQFNPVVLPDGTAQCEHRESKDRKCLCGKPISKVLTMVSVQSEGIIQCEIGCDCALKHKIIDIETYKKTNSKCNKRAKQRKLMRERIKENEQLQKEYGKQYCPGYGDNKDKCKNIIDTDDHVGLCCDCIVYKYQVAKNERLPPIKKCKNCDDPLDRNHRCYNEFWYNECSKCYRSRKEEERQAGDRAHYYNREVETESDTDSSGYALSDSEDSATSFDSY